MGRYVCMSHDDRTRAETKRSQWYPGTKTALRVIQGKALKMSKYSKAVLRLSTDNHISKQKKISHFPKYLVPEVVTS